jgi:hypothetical protein
MVSTVKRRRGGSDLAVDTLFERMLDFMAFRAIGNSVEENIYES